MRLTRSSFLLVAILLTGGLSAATSSAAGAEVCDPTPKVDASFCATYDLAVTAPGTSTAETHAAAPADLTFSLSNTSTHHDSDTSVWLDHVTVSLLRGFGPIYTPSSQLDAGLLIAGSNTACGSGADFSGCAAGHGAFYANVSGTGGLFDGVHPGTFGIQRITNIDPGGSGGGLDWQMQVAFCLNSGFNSCNAGSPQSEDFELTSSGIGAGYLTLPATTAFNYNYGAGTANVDASLDSLSGVHLLGVSGTLGTDGSPAPSGSQTVLHLPTHCGTVDGSATAIDRGGEGSATVPLSLNVVGCPTAKLTAKEPKPYTVALDATGSSVGTAGRTLTKFHWTFGDGRTKVTTGPKVTHVYSAAKPRTITVVAEDLLGALSKARALTLKGVAISLTSKHSAVSGTKVDLAGRLTQWHSSKGLGHRALRLERCKANGTHCSPVASLHTASSGAWSTKALYSARKPMFRISFAGGGGFIGARAGRTIAAK